MAKMDLENLEIADGYRGIAWGTYRRSNTGGLHRVVSRYLPLRDTPEAATDDLVEWLKGIVYRSGTSEQRRQAVAMLTRMGKWKSDERASGSGRD